MEKLPREFAALVDETSSSLNPCWNGGRSIFIDGSPMTHDTRFSLRIQNRPGLIAAAILYDFIPLDWPGYLPTVASRIEYIAKLARLKKFDLFFPISQYTAALLFATTGVSRKKINVTGVCLELVQREAVFPLDDFHDGVVGDRFWNVVSQAAEERPGAAAAVASHRKPRLAFISPYPPDPSDAASYAAGCVKAGKELFDSDVYANATRRITDEGAFSDVAAISPAPFVDQRYNAIISMLGNSSWHKRAFEIFERYGGPCILHDVRLTHIYFARLGTEGFLRFACGLLNRPVLIAEAQAWLRDQNPPSLFAERVVDRAAPLMVRTRTQRALLKKYYAVEAHVLTSCPTVIFEEQELTAAARQIKREKLGILPNTFLISSFGPVEKANEIHTCILALELLRSWNIPAELYFAGDVGSHNREIERISTLYDVSGHVHFGGEFANDGAYRDFLMASDAAAQLQPYGFGQPPVDLTNCISAGLAAVANKDAAESCDAPAYISMVPDVFSPLQVAEKLALIWEAETESAARKDARAQYLETHNFEYYAKRLVEVLRTA